MKLHHTYLCVLALAVLTALPSCVAPCAPYAPACGPRMVAPCGGYNYSYRQPHCHQPAPRFRHCY